MRKKLFTSLLALVASVGMSWAVEETYTWDATICHDINCSRAGNTNNTHFDITAEWNQYNEELSYGFTNNTMTFQRYRSGITFKSSIGAVKKVVITGVDLTNTGCENWALSDGNTKMTWTDEYLIKPQANATLRFDLESAAEVTTFTVTSIECTVDNDCAKDEIFERCQKVSDSNISKTLTPGQYGEIDLDYTNNPFGKTNAGWKLQSVGYYQPNATTEQINTMYEAYDNPQEAYESMTTLVEGLLNPYVTTDPTADNWAEYSSKIEVYELLKYNSSTSTYEHAKIYSTPGASTNETGYGVIHTYYKNENVLCDLYTAAPSDAYLFFLEAWPTDLYREKAYFLHHDPKYDKNKVARYGGKITWALEIGQDFTLREVSIYSLPTSKGEVAYTGWQVELINTGSINGGTWEYSFDGINYNEWDHAAIPCGDYTIYCRIVPDEYHKYTGENPVVVLPASIVPPFVTDMENPSSVLWGLEGNTSDLLVKRTIYADGYYNTLCLPFSITAAELAQSTHPLHGYETLKTMRGAQVSGSGQNLTIDIFVEDATEIVAGQPYLISYPAEREDIVNPYFAGITVTVTGDPAGSVSADGVTFQGMLGPQHIISYADHSYISDNHDYLFLGEQNELTWPLQDYQNMRGFRAYFIIDRAQITPAMAPANTRARLVDASKMPTDVESIQSSAIGSQKVIENGVLYIMKNGVRYNAQGQVVK